MRRIAPIVLAAGLVVSAPFARSLARADESNDSTPLTETPSLVGRDMVDARRIVLAHGLVPSLRIVSDAGRTSWSVVAQDLRSGVVVAAGSSLGFDVAGPRDDDGLTRVPGTFGLAEDDAVALLRAARLEPEVAREPSRASVGRVFSTSFEPGSRLRRGERVVVRVATTPPEGWAPTKVVVPNLVGSKPSLAFGELIRLGLVPRWRWRDAVKDPPGSIVAQTPAAGAEVEPGTEVAFVEPALARVPDVVGLDRSRAESALLSAGLAPLVDVRESTGVVAESSPLAGRWTNRGAQVRLHFLAGDAPTAPPSDGLAPFDPSAGDPGWPPPADMPGRRAEEGGPPAAASPSPTVPAWPPPGSEDPGAGAPPPVDPGAPSPTAPEAPPSPPTPPAPSPTLPDWRPGMDASSFFVSVPDVRRMVLTRARTVLTAAGLVVGSIRGAGGIVRDEDVVDTQDPAPGIQVRRRSAVRLTTRPAPGTVIVPDFRGRRVDIAMRTLSINGLVGRVVPGTRGTDGIVDVQNPAAFARVTLGSEVVLYDSPGSPPPRPPSGAGGGTATVRVPVLRGQTPDAARRALTALGLSSTLEGPVDRPGTQRLVTTTVPAGGSDVPRASAIRVITTLVPLSPTPGR